MWGAMEKCHLSGDAPVVSALGLARNATTSLAPAAFANATTRLAPAAVATATTASRAAATTVAVATATVAKLHDARRRPGLLPVERRKD